MIKMYTPIAYSLRQCARQYVSMASTRKLIGITIASFDCYPLSAGRLKSRPHRFMSRPVRFECWIDSSVFIKIKNFLFCLEYMTGGTHRVDSWEMPIGFAIQYPRQGTERRAAIVVDEYVFYFLLHQLQWKFVSEQKKNFRLFFPFSFFQVKSTWIIPKCIQCEHKSERRKKSKKHTRLLSVKRRKENAEEVKGGKRNCDE